MRFLVVDIAAEFGGALSVLKDFYEFVRTDLQARTHRWHFIVSTSELEPQGHISISIVSKGRFSWISRLWSDNMLAKKEADIFKPDLVLSLQNTIIKGISTDKQAVYIHQSIPFQNAKTFSFLKKKEFVLAIYQHIIGQFISHSAQQARIVFVQTKWMKKNVALRSKCNVDKISVIPVNRDVSLLSTTSSANWSNKSFFYPAFYTVYKNQDLILKATKILESKGIEDISVTLTTRSGFGGSLIKETGRISHEEVMTHLKKSTLIFPSYIETVGLPLIEAMEARTVILAADCEYAHETLYGYENAYFFNPFDPASLATLIEEVYKGVIKKKDINPNTNPAANHWLKMLEVFQNTL